MRSATKGPEGGGCKLVLMMEVAIASASADRYRDASRSGDGEFSSSFPEMVGKMIGLVT